MKRSVWLLVAVLISAQIVISAQKVFTRSQIHEDLRELLDIVETTHPDPYSGGGGKIAFHRRFQQAIQQVPAKGMTKAEFEWLLQPWINSIADGHTAILHSDFNYNPREPFGIPLWFSISGDGQLYVSKVAQKELVSLLGARLIGVDGYDLDQLIKRTRRLYPCQNRFDALRNLNTMLWEPYFLQQFLPKAHRRKQLRVSLQGVDEIRVSEVFDLSHKREYPLIKNHNSKFKLPESKGEDFYYGLLTPTGETAFLSIDSQDCFREVIEYARYHRFDPEVIRKFAGSAYRKIHNQEPPTDLDALSEGLPSATQCFQRLTARMKELGTQTLIVDLSRNHGGQSILSRILVYFLYGREGLIKLEKSAFSIDKYSPRYFRTFANRNLKKIKEEHKKRHSWEITEIDYAFASEERLGHMREGGIPLDEILKSLSEEFKAYASFYNAFKEDRHYAPPRVIVISDVRTYSAGFGTLVDLYQCGAEIVGIPSGQSANCCGNAIGFSLKNTGVRGFVATRYIELMPGDPGKGKVLMPNHVLTYDTIKGFGFAPDSLYRYAVKLAGP